MREEACLPRENRRFSGTKSLEFCIAKSLRAGEAGKREDKDSQQFALSLSKGPQSTEIPLFFPLMLIKVI